MRIGLSWILDTRRGEPLVEHSGRDVGFVSHVTILPDGKSGVVVLDALEKLDGVR